MNPFVSIIYYCMYVMCCYCILLCAQLIQYDNINGNLFVILRIYDEIDLNIILYGNTEFSIDQSNDISRAVQVFLIDSNIFG